MSISSIPSSIRRSVAGTSGGSGACVERSSLTCSRLKPGGHWPAYDTVRKWTKGTDIFSKRFIIVPINEESVGSDLTALALRLINQSSLVPCRHIQSCGNHALKRRCQ